MAVSVLTLFAANAIVLLVTTLAFFAAWRGQGHEPYWLSWIAANVTIAVASLLLMAAADGHSPPMAAVANATLLLGFALRWRAARQFGRRPISYVPILLPPVVIAALSVLPPNFDYVTVYTGTNALLAVQAGSIAYEFWRDRADRLPSRFGLVLAYGILATSCVSGVGLGVVLGDGLANHLTQATVLQAQLLAGLLHSIASGAFALSIAYERDAASLREVTLRDPLTCAYNRRAFEERLQSHVADGSGRDFAVVILDIDHFKAVNDRYGHAAGDAALCVCADTITQSFRATDIVARVGGEEFAVILPDVTAESARELADRVRRLVAMRDIISHGHRFRITLSGGIVHNSSGWRDMDSLMKAADAALYRAKNAGRNRIEQTVRITSAAAVLCED
jgi:diguanylate cyclase (GGDEF)-like protein